MKFNKRGVAMELAIGFMALITVLIVLSFTIFMTMLKQRQLSQQTIEQTYIADQIAEDYCYAVTRNATFPNYSGGNYTSVDGAADKFKYCGVEYSFSVDESATNKKIFTLKNSGGATLVVVKLSKDGLNWKVASWTNN